MRIAVGIPSFNEAATIQNVAGIADRGLSTWFRNHDCVLINMDSGSTDGTPDLFERVNTHFPKKILRNGQRGKGRNIRSLLEYLLDEEIDYACMIDADLQSISPRWIHQLIAPLMRGDISYVVPVYERSRYEATTTNHFCYPLITVLFGVPIRQPIGGEFGFDRAFARHLLASHWPSAAYEYGIDILMTLRAVIAGCNIEEIHLGQKVHNNSWPKTNDIFLQAAGTMLTVIKSHDFRGFKYQGRFVRSDHAARRGDGSNFPRPTEDTIRNGEAAALALLEKILHGPGLNPFHLTQDRLLEEYQTSRRLTGADWMRSVAEAMRVLAHECRGEHDIERLACNLLPLYLLRSVSCFREISELDGEAVEQIFEDQIAHLRRYIGTQC